MDTGASAARHYAGPVIDAHHHFWDLGLGKHGWLDAGRPDDGLQPLRRDYLPNDYLRDLGGEEVVASVHVEANWDPADPFGETQWLDRLVRPPGIAERYVVYAELGTEGVAAHLEQHALNPRVSGVREIISWHPDPAKRRRPDNDAMTSTAWRANLARLAGHGFCFELLLSPHQLMEARRLADSYPDITFVLNHCGSPMDRDADGMSRWRTGLEALGKAANVVIKISDPVAYDPEWTEASLREVMEICLQTFGPDRALFATDFPVAKLHIDMRSWFGLCRRVLATYSNEEQKAFFYDNAARLYRLEAASRGKTGGA